ncbi:MAG TPA: class III extradiol ring-cleavage dioxygenase [Armatimonadota bacterium]|jgi:4,5-DOPA dioxygenase extradiol
MTAIPSIFVGHGAPTLAIDASPTHHFLQRLGGDFPRPKAVVCASAHWETMTPSVSAAPHPDTLYDFYGFPPELYRIQYPASGTPEVAARVADLLHAAGIDCAIEPQRGLDHGAWVPLSLMYPDAGIQVIQLAVLHRGSTADHYALGQALAPLREEGVLILGSGNATHNLHEIGPYFETPDVTPPEWVRAFDAWLTDVVLGGKLDDLLAYRERAPLATRNHPTEEHFMPLLVALGAGGENAVARKLHDSFSYGILSMASYAFG